MATMTLARRRVPALPFVGALSNWSTGKTLIAPAVIYAIIVTQLPFVVTVWYSLLRWNLLRPDNVQFAGVDNYLFVITADPIFRFALINTLILTVGSVIASLVFGMLFAELVNHRYPGRGIVRTMFITPFLIMPVVSALTWKNMMLNPVFGVVDYLMQLVRLPTVDWLAQFPLAAITGIVVWRWAPFMMLIPLAGMQSLSDEIRDAARVDGVTGFQEFSIYRPTPPEPLHPAGGAARLRLHRPGVRQHLHDHAGRTGYGEYQPAVPDLPARLRQ